MYKQATALPELGVMFWLIMTSKLPRDATLARNMLSSCVHLFVCLSVRHNRCSIETQTMLHVDSPGTLSRRLRIQLVYLGSRKLYSINKKRVLIKFIINTADIFTQIYSEDAAEYDDINFVRIEL